MMTTLLLVDDHTIVLQGLRALLDPEPNLKVIGEAVTGMDAIAKAAELHPDVVVLDLALPDINGLEVTRQICEKPNHPEVVILSMHQAEGYVLEALRYGAKGFVLKGADASELKRAIAHARQGKRYLSPPLDEKAIAAYVDVTKAQKASALDTLTKRERQIFVLAASGLSAAGIADHLGIALRTAETHRSRVMDKLGVHSQAELERFARMHGLGPLDQSAPAYKDDPLQ